MKLIIEVPKSSKKAAKYTIDTIFNDFLGLSYEIKHVSNHSFSITDSDGLKCIEISSVFFELLEKNGLVHEILPKIPIQNWHIGSLDLSNLIPKNTLPVLFGRGYLQIEKDYIKTEIDIFGAVFFMLSRIEEVISPEKDKYERFPSRASIASKENFLQRPIVDEYVEYLWALLLKLWPSLRRKKTKGRNIISCDVDWPCDPALNSFFLAFKKSLILFKNFRPLASLSLIKNYLLKKIGLEFNDEYLQNIEYIIEVNNKYGNVVNFNFIFVNTSPFDTNEDFNSSKIRGLLRRIHSSGHNIGIHPGFNTFNNKKNFSDSVKEFKRILAEEDITQNLYGGRQHFLRWDQSITPLLWENSNLDFDSSLGYADKAGFRCGTSKEFYMYDVINNNKLHLKQIPLIVMESTVLSKRYENLGYSKAAINRFNNLKNACLRYNGNFSLLWHNSHFDNPKDKLMYEELIS